MRVKVLIVDDEKLERVLIRKSFDWEGNGFEVAGEASSGEEALRFIEVSRPRLILTDISMPFMDGLEMAREIMERGYPCKVVIITGYRDFEYARQAVRLGVNDFILKPVHADDIKEAVLKLKDEIEAEYSHSKHYEELITREDQNQRIVLESFLQRLAEGRVMEAEAINKLMLFGCDQIAESCLCCVVRLHFLSGESVSVKDNDEKNLQAVELLHNHRLIPKNHMAFVHYQGFLVVFMAGKPAGDMDEIRQDINKALKLEAVVGLSRLNTGFEGIRASFLQAKEAVNISVIRGRNVCISYDEFEEIRKIGHSSMDIDWDGFSFSLENGITGRALEYIDQYTRLIAENKRIDLNYVKLMSMNLISKAMIPLWKKGKDLSQLAGEDYVYNQINRIENLEDMNRILKEMASQIISYLNRDHKKENMNIKKVLEYMELHMLEPDLSLRTVAKALYLNSSYLSRMFKQEVGENMMEYIMRKRMEESIRLINTTDLKAYEIAERVGISDPHYFSICFKKYVGVTIKEYKNIR